MYSRCGVAMRRHAAPPAQPAKPAKPAQPPQLARHDGAAESARLAHGAAPPLIYAARSWSVSACRRANSMPRAGAARSSVPQQHVLKTCSRNPFSRRVLIIRAALFPCKRLLVCTLLGALAAQCVLRRLSGAIPLAIILFSLEIANSALVFVCSYTCSHTIELQ